MAEELHILLFHVRGNIATEEKESSGSVPTESNGSDLTGELGKEADDICQKVEREIRKNLPPTVTVQASLQFETGSVLITGTIALLSWAVPIVQEGAKKELAELVKIGIHRVISRQVRGFFTSAGSPPTLAISVTPQSTTSEPTPKSTTSEPTPLFAGAKISASTALFVVTGLILILQNNNATRALPPIAHPRFNFGSPFCQFSLRTNRLWIVLSARAAGPSQSRDCTGFEKPKKKALLVRTYGQELTQIPQLKKH
jgi:hypothetical protein